MRDGGDSSENSGDSEDEHIARNDRSASKGGRMRHTDDPFIKAYDALLIARGSDDIAAAFRPGDGIFFKEEQAQKKDDTKASVLLQKAQELRKKAGSELVLSEDQDIEVEYYEKFDEEERKKRLVRLYDEPNKKKAEKPLVWPFEPESSRDSRTKNRISWVLRSMTAKLCEISQLSDHGFGRRTNKKAWMYWSKEDDIVAATAAVFGGQYPEPKDMPPAPSMASPKTKKNKKTSSSNSQQKAAALKLYRLIDEAQTSAKACIGTLTTADVYNMKEYELRERLHLLQYNHKGISREDTLRKRLLCALAHVRQDFRRLYGFNSDPAMPLCQTAKEQDFHNRLVEKMMKSSQTFAAFNNAATSESDPSWLEGGSDSSEEFEWSTQEESE